MGEIGQPLDAWMASYVSDIFFVKCLLGWVSWGMAHAIPSHTGSSVTGKDHMELIHPIYQTWLRKSFHWLQALLIMKGVGALLVRHLIWNLKWKMISVSINLMGKIERSCLWDGGRLNSNVSIQFNSTQMGKIEKINSEMISDVSSYLASETIEFQGFIFVGGDGCVIIVYRVEEDDKMTSTIYPLICCWRSNESGWTTWGMWSAMEWEGFMQKSILSLKNEKFVLCSQSHGEELVWYLGGKRLGWFWITC
jgi:hypothetical protein